MKKLITAADVKTLSQNGESRLNIDKDTIITPSAIDSAKGCGIELVYGGVNENKPCCSAKVQPQQKKDNCCSGISSKDIEFITQIVRQVLKETSVKKSAESFVKESDISGLTLIRGNTVSLDRFDQGNPGSRVGLKDILNTKESQNLGAGFMTIDSSSFDWELSYEEIDYIVEGELSITINGNRYKGKTGDVFYIPKNSKITWSSDGFAKFFYTTYPGNWAELASNRQ